MIYNEHLKKEYNRVIGKINHELNSVLAMSAIALAFIDIVSFASAAVIYGENVPGHLLSAAMTFAVLFAVLLTAKQVSMYFIREKVRRLLIESRAAANAESVVYKEHRPEEDRTISA